MKKELTPEEMAKAEDLAKTINNDYNSYNQRHHLASISFTRNGSSPEYLELVKELAEFRMKVFGCKYKVREIKKASEIALKRDREHALEIMRDKVEDGAEINASARLWFDKLNGNTYHSVFMNVAGFGVYLPMTYGYGEQWKQTATEWLWKNNILEKTYWANQSPRYQESYQKINWGSAVDSKRRDL